MEADQSVYLSCSNHGLGRWRPLLVLLAMVFVTRPSIADTVWLVDEKKPVFGLVESIQNGQIQFQRTNDGISFEQVKIDQNSVQSMVISHNAERLGALTHGDWGAWHEYAEELFSQRSDPVARALAIRLLVIVLGNSKETELRKAALADLVSLARNDEEREKLRQLQYLETGKQIAATESQTKQSLPSIEERKSAAQRIKSIRLGRNVGQLADDDSLRKVIAAFEETCSWQELIQIANSNRIDDQSLRLLVALEIELLTKRETTNATERRFQWHTLAARVGSSTLNLPSIETVTEFDPLATRFENGKWTRR